MSSLLQAVLIGVFATIAIDLWAQFLKRGLGQTTTNWGMVGRWFGHMPRGKFTHHPIGKSDPVANERVIGWTAHYIIGITYAFLYLVIVDRFLHGQPTLLSAVIFGLVTVVAPWFLMQPGLGMGVMASKVPNPGSKRLASLSVHAVFGVALFAGWWLFRQLGFTG
jgi:hypothetical protein